MATDFRRHWAGASALGAAVVTVCDALLLQRSKNYFTGGFLSVDYLEGPLDVVLFLGASFLIDFGLIGLITGVLAWVLRSRLALPARVFAGALISTSLLVAVDVVSYGILRYLGDVFDLQLMFDLTGRSVREILAVSADHLIMPAILTGVAVVGLAAAIGAANRYWSGATRAALSVRAVLLPVVVAAIAAAALTVATKANVRLENGLLRKPAGRFLASIIDQLSDVDADGFGMVGRNSDPAPFDSSIFPYALDQPANGIDENGVGGDLPTAASSYEEPSHASSTWLRRPDVVLIVLESFRADVVGAREGDVAVTPMIDAIAARGVTVRLAFSHNGYTVQSRHHLFTGSLLAVPTESTLIDDFLRNGYRVGYFSGQDESFGGTKYDVGLRRATVAMDARDDRERRYTTTTTPGSLGIANDVVRERVGQFLDAHGTGDAPLFLYVNFHDTHFPYSHPGIETLTSDQRIPRSRIAPERRDELWRTYTNTAANVDRAIGEVVKAVQRVRGHEPGIVITADHGESLFDEGFLGHGYALNDVQTRIPLVVANLPLMVPEPFGQADLRNALNTALCQPGSAYGTPVLQPSADRELFQYLGDLSRPRQIALVTQSGRLIYDFRSKRVQLPNGSWQPTSDLGDSDRLTFSRLVNKWEAISLARGDHQPEVID